MSDHGRTGTEAPVRPKKSSPTSLSTSVLAALMIVLGITPGGWWLPPVSHGQERPWMTSLSISTSTGKYGTDIPTSVVYVPMTVRRLFEDGDLSLTIPFVSVTGDCSVTLLNGIANRTGGTCRQRTVSLFGGAFTRTFTLPEVVNNQGLGDLVLQGRYYAVEERQWLPLIAVTGRVKIPTANPAIGLGTGEFDEGMGIEASKEFWTDWLVFADAGFSLIGKVKEVNLRNQWNYDVGVGYYVTDQLLMSVSYEEWRAIVTGLKNPRDVLVGVNYKVTEAFRANFSTLIGLSDGAPDYGLTGGVTIRF